MIRDPYIEQRWPGIFPILEPYGLIATWLPAEDESVDDSIEIRLMNDDEDIADLQYGLDRLWTANVWTSSSREARSFGELRQSPEQACRDLISLLGRYNWINVR